MPLSSRFELLLHKWVSQTLTQEERSEFMHLLETQTLESASPALTESWSVIHRQLKAQPPVHDDRDDNIARRILSRYPAAKPTVPVHRIHFLRRSWFRYAAAIIFSAGLGTLAYLLTTNNKADQVLVGDKKHFQTDIPPGGEKAVLTLAGGTRIILDNAANGTLAQQGSAQVVKLANGQIAYNSKALVSKEIFWNTMSTPKGGQYQITLPDGTKVWLNAASSITFPTAFRGDNRLVKIDGEVFFEVAGNSKKPFIVDIDGKSLVQVLGTSFNINSYTDEGSIKTTLVEGSVRVSANNTTAVSASAGRQSKRLGTEGVILKPGQQAAITVGRSSDGQPNNTAAISVKSDVDLDQALAWKNGIFNFHNADLKTVMKQLERWYDIKVHYNNSKSDFTFKGKMYRNLNLSDVLEMLSRNGIRFRMEGKTLIIL